MRRRDAMLIFVKGVGLVAIADLFKGCVGIVGPEKQSDILEFMYERVLPVIAPSEKDPSWIQLYNPKCNPILIYTFNWRIYGPNSWVAERELYYNPYYQYAIYTLDLKVTGVYRHIARKIYARIKGTNDWIELTRIRPHYYDYENGGEQAEFLLDSKGIHFEF